MPTVFDFLAEVERRPGMYGSQLSALESMLFGYRVALRTHRVDESVPDMQHFAAWLGRETGWSMACGWAVAFDDHVPRDECMERFFAYIARFELLRPVVVATVSLEPRHQPTGERVEIGFGGCMERPDRIEVVQYQPEPLHFLRFVDPRRTVVDSILRVNRPDGTLDVETDLDDAKGWVAAEFQVRPDDWD